LHTHYTTEQLDTVLANKNIYWIICQSNG